MKNLAMRSSIQGQDEKRKQQVRQPKSFHCWETNMGADRGTNRVTLTFCSLLVGTTGETTNELARENVKFEPVPEE